MVRVCFTSAATSAATSDSMCCPSGSTSRFRMASASSCLPATAAAMDRWLAASHACADVPRSPTIFFDSSSSTESCSVVMIEYDWRISASRAAGHRGSPGSIRARRKFWSDLRKCASMSRASTSSLSTCPATRAFAALARVSAPMPTLPRMTASASTTPKPVMIFRMIEPRTVIPQSKSCISRAPSSTNPASAVTPIR